MLSQSCYCLPNKRQSIFGTQSPQKMGLLRSLSSKPCSGFEDPADNVGIDFKDTKKNSINDFSSKATRIMDLVYYSLTETSSVKFDKSYISTLPIPSESSKLNCKEITHCDTMTTSPLVRSYLVGGFVGSKSQLGRRRKNNCRKMNLWDIIRDMVDSVGNTQPINPGKRNQHTSSWFEKKCEILHNSSAQKDSGLGLGLLNNHFVGLASMEEPLNPQKQSYAEVAKRPSRDCQPVKISAWSMDQPTVASSPISVIESVSSCNRTNSYSRDRETSVCSADSEDSFIVFEYCEDDTVDKDVYSSEDETLSCFDEVSKSDSGLVPSSGSSFCITPPLKKVQFVEGKKLVKVHPMVTWDFAYRMARRGPWEMMARDAERFKIRIAKTEAVLKPILDPQHRSVVFRDRFSKST